MTTYDEMVNKYGPEHRVTIETPLRYTFDGSDPELGGHAGYLAIPDDTRIVRAAMEQPDGTWREVFLPWVRVPE